ncbi:MAG: DUF2848 domain-containing protein, partial [Streptosporangiales bacterium]|nr:DUF2848 domain-containing protein [Streptosporangiales bacterium]
MSVTGAPGPLALRPRRLVIAGYTGRDEAAVREHIEELARAGIPPPPAVPMFYELDPRLLTAAPAVEVAGDRTSGEAEPVLIRVDGRWYLGVGSDHTDRALEREDIAAAKAACPKPLGAAVRALPSEVERGAFDQVWDGTTVVCRVDGHTYQQGPLAALRRPSDLLNRLPAGADELADRPACLVLDPAADGQGGEHDREVGFDRVAFVVVDGPGLQVV